MIQQLNLNSKWNYLSSTLNLNSRINTNLTNPLRFQQRKNLTTTHLNTSSFLLKNHINNDTLNSISSSSLDLSKLSLYQCNNISKKYYSTPSDNPNNNENKDIKDSPNVETSKNSNSKKDNKNNKKKEYKPNPVISFVFFIVGASAGSFLAHALFDALDEIRRQYRERKLSSVGGNKVLDDDDDSGVPSPDEPELTPAMVTRFLRKNEFTTFSDELEETKNKSIDDDENINKESTDKNNSKAEQDVKTSVIGYVYLY